MGPALLDVVQHGRLLHAYLYEQVGRAVYFYLVRSRLYCLRVAGR
jgi:hypothetical protein